MPQCDFCDKKTVFGNSVEMRGKAKYLGGNGRKTTGITRRKFQPNLQRIRIEKDGKAVRARVCTQCLRSGKVQKAIVRKLFTLPTE